MLQAYARVQTRYRWPNVPQVRDLARPGLQPSSFELARGECLAVRGRSGSGKTLLLRALADLDPTVGEISLDGRARDEMSGPQWRASVGYLAADAGWWADRVGDHFEDWPALRASAAALLLPGAIGEAMVDAISTGERQRLALLRAVERAPRVLLLDEPTSARVSLSWWASTD